VPSDRVWERSSIIFLDGYSDTEGSRRISIGKTLGGGRILAMKSFLGANTKKHKKKGRSIKMRKGGRGIREVKGISASTGNQGGGGEHLRKQVL